VPVRNRQTDAATATSGTRMLTDRVGCGHQQDVHGGEILFRKIARGSCDLLQGEPEGGTAVPFDVKIAATDIPKGNYDNRSKYKCYFVRAGCGDFGLRIRAGVMTELLFSGIVAGFQSPHILSGRVGPGRGAEPAPVQEHQTVT